MRSLQAVLFYCLLRTRPGEWPETPRKQLSATTYLMPAKPRPNDALYLDILRSMSPADRLRKAVELTEMSRKLFWIGLRQRFPEMPEEELKALYLSRLE